MCSKVARDETLWGANPPAGGFTVLRKASRRIMCPQRRREGAAGKEGVVGGHLLWWAAAAWKNPDVFRPPPSRLVLDGVSLGVGRCGQVTHRDRTGVLGALCAPFLLFQSKPFSSSYQKVFLPFVHFDEKKIQKMRKSLTC